MCNCKSASGSDIERQEKNRSDFCFRGSILALSKPLDQPVSACQGGAGGFNMAAFSTTGQDPADVGLYLFGFFPPLDARKCEKKKAHMFNKPLSLSDVEI